MSHALGEKPTPEGAPKGRRNPPRPGEPLRAAAARRSAQAGAVQQRPGRRDQRSRGHPDPAGAGLADRAQRGRPRRLRRALPAPSGAHERSTTRSRTEDTFKAGLDQLGEAFVERGRAPVVADTIGRLETEAEDPFFEPAARRSSYYGYYSMPESWTWPSTEEPPGRPATTTVHRCPTATCRHRRALGRGDPVRPAGGRRPTPSPSRTSSGVDLSGIDLDPGSNCPAGRRRGGAASSSYEETDVLIIGSGPGGRGYRAQAGQGRHYGGLPGAGPLGASRTDHPHYPDDRRSRAARLGIPPQRAPAAQDYPVTGTRRRT